MANYKTVRNSALLTANSIGEWIDIEPKDNQSNLSVQFYWAGNDNTDSTVYLDMTIDKGLNATYGILKSTAVITLTTTTGVGQYEFTNYGYRQLRMNWLKGSVTTLATLKAWLAKS